MAAMAKITTYLNGTKKDIILKNAATLFRTKGFKATSVRELAESLGIEAPSLYNHIGSKAEMLQDICFEVATDFTVCMDAVLAMPNNAVQKTTHLLHYHLQKLYNDFDKVYVADYEWKQLPKKQMQSFLAIRKQYENNFISIIQEGVQQQSFKNLQPKIVVLTLLSAVRGLELLQNKKNEFSLQALQDNMTDLLLNGIIN